MIENFEKIILSSEEKDYLLDHLNYDLALALACNYELVNKNILLLGTNSIQDIAEIMQLFPDFFLRSVEFNTKKMSKYNIDALRMVIQEDITVFSELM